jgi:hypothetical protein
MFNVLSCKENANESNIVIQFLFSHNIYRKKRERNTSGVNFA